ncbi:Leucine-rich repeat receptor protein kinase EXS [Acorus gramineus]|uniref:non-specific serine/threonine protein kinase n=1 Tax=Acorus gramineus TaxID=55184 RepID=A0AAV9A212_ACOGR|nr:Leucine-rich repeat receptor protein kinase EXS [Acorus gramineus]
MKMKRFTLIFFTFTFLINENSAVQNQAKSRPPSTPSSSPETEALLAFKSALETPHILSDWNHTLHHCNWTGITCTYGGHVTTVSLPSLSLSGPISPSLGNLTRLASLDFSNNLLSGPLPPDLFIRLGSLTFLDVTNNSLSGRIPPELGLLTSLEVLNLGINRFSGPFPREIGRLRNLRSLYAASCSIEGPIPDELTKLKQLDKLDLSYNPIMSPIPDSIGELRSLVILNLVESGINGSIPLGLGSCRDLETVLLSSNSLTGSLPDSLADLRPITFSAESNQLSGPLPAWLGSWTSVDSLLLSDNQFSGPLPLEIGNCSSLTSITLSNNMLMGPIPPEICDAGLLSEVELDRNYFTGTIEWTFHNCTNLTQLFLNFNRLQGRIPDYVSGLPLMVLMLDSNNFTGEIPKSLWNLTGLIAFSAVDNLLEGAIPPEIGNAVDVERVLLSRNRLRGFIPREMGRLKSMTVLFLDSNTLEGSIPSEIGGCDSLTTLDLSYNFLNGLIPENLSGLGNLQCLVLSHNDLSGPIPSKPSKYFRRDFIPESSFIQHHGVFDLSYNSLSGPIPEDLGQCTVIVDLLIGNNRLSGVIPPSLSRLANLTTLDLSGNYLTGPIPAELGDSISLQGLYLGNNWLNGSVPGSLASVSSLVKLNLSSNRLSGRIPPSLGYMTGLTHLDLSSNELVGELPTSLTQMVNLVGLYVQQNKLSGGIEGVFASSVSWKIETLNLSLNSFRGPLPGSLGNLSYLAYLDFHGNDFCGKIPQELGNLTQLVYFDVSDNNLSGPISDRFCDLSDLVYSNFSNNRLRGPIPGRGVCMNFTRASFLGNEELCGGILGSNCANEALFKGRPVLKAWGVVVITACSVFVPFGLIYTIIRCRAENRDDRAGETTSESKLSSSAVEPNLCFLTSSSGFREPLSINIATFEAPLLKLTIEDILEATNNFCKANIVGDGGFGTVYKAQLPGGQTIAVKKLNQAKNQGHREFLAEMETLGKVKHRNLVPLLGYCSYGEEKLLVYEYMVNGSLDLWLRKPTGGALEVLDWPKRVKIAVGAARGLAFLHHGFTPHIIHRDIKASNILLDEGFEARVSDFGLARLISACETHVSTDIAGTFGYIPPEYGQSWRSTTKGDVYSFGVILLELLTGMEPTGSEFKELEGGNLAGWVQEMIAKGRAVYVLDVAVLSVESKLGMMRMLQVAVACLSESPASRPTMLNVLKFLKGIEDGLI